MILQTLKRVCLCLRNYITASSFAVIIAILIQFTWSGWLNSCIPDHVLLAGKTCLPSSSQVLDKLVRQNSHLPLVSKKLLRRCLFHLLNLVQMRVRFQGRQMDQYISLFVEGNCIRFPSESKIPALAKHLIIIIIIITVLSTNFAKPQCFNNIINLC